MTTNKDNRVIAIIISVILVFSILPEPALLADAISPYTEIEHLPDGVTIYHNKDGSKTAVIEVTDEQIEEMSDEEEADRLVDTGDFLEGTDDKVDVNIKEEFTEDDSLVTVKKDNTSIAFYPVINADDKIEEITKDIQMAIDNSVETLQDEEPIPSELPDNTDAPAENTSDTKNLTISDEVITYKPTEESPENSEDSSGNQDTTEDDETQTVEPAESPQPTQSETISPITPSSQQTESVSPIADEDSIAEDKGIDASKQGYNNGTYDSALYENLFDEETDIELSALKGGVKENIIINEYVGNHSFSYVLDLKGLTPEKDGGSIILRDAYGKMTAKIAAPFMQDSNGSYSDDIAVELKLIGENLYQLMYTPRDAWLSSDSRRYPVQIDPTITYTSSDTYGIEDNYVSDNKRNTVNQYNASSFYVGNYNGGNHMGRQLFCRQFAKLPCLPSLISPLSMI